MAVDLDAANIDFRRGQVDALARVHLGRNGLFSPELRHTLALQVLSRTWAQYREDRAITLGARLVGAECAAERNAFLTLLAQALPPHNASLADAIRTVRRIAVAPLAAEARQADERVTSSAPEIAAVMDTLASSRLPSDPFERVLAIISHHRYSLRDQNDTLSATAYSSCWAINLLAVARPEAFGLCPLALPSPGIVRRRLFRADLGVAARRDGAREVLLEVLHDVACEIDRVWHAARQFSVKFPRLRSNSRACSAWLLTFGLNELTPAQLARALPATKAGAGKLLRQLEAARLVRANGAYEPYSCNPVATAAFATGAR